MGEEFEDCTLLTKYDEEFFNRFGGGKYFFYVIFSISSEEFFTLREALRRMIYSSA